MPGRFLTDAERERFTGFPKTTPLEECVTSFTLSPTDLDLVRLLRGGKNRLGCALQLGSIRYLGFAPDDLTTAPETVVSYVAAQLDIDPAELAGYGQRAHTRTDHLQAVLTHLKFRLPTAEDLGVLASWLTERALEHDSPLVLFISASDHLKSLSIVRPGVTVLERLVVIAREAAHQETYRRLEPLLTETLLPQLDLLLLVSPETNRTPLTWLRSGAVANTPEEILASLDKLRYLRGLGVAQWELKVVSPNRIKFLAQIGKRTTNQALQRMLPQRRYPILVAFLADALETITDQTVDLVNECLAAAYHRAEHDLDRFRRRYAKATNEKLRYFDIMGRLTLDHSIPDFALRQRIHEQIPPDDLEIALNENHIIMRPLDDNYVDFFGKRFNYIRQFSLRYLDTLQFHAYEDAHPLLIAISHLRRTKRLIPKDAPLSFVPWRWHPYVVTSDGTLNRAYYELCTLMALREELRAGNIWLEHSRRYADPATYLIPTEQWASDKAEICTLLGVSESGEEQLKLRQKELEDVLSTFDAALPMEEVRIENHALVVSPLTAEHLPERVLQVREWVSASLPLVDLVDLLIEVDGDLHFTDHLTHAGGQETRMPDLKISLYAAILAQGCNYGLMRMAQMADLPYETLVWATEWYIRDETLKAANAAIVNAHHQLPLSQRWGGGTMSSSDGQRFPVPVKARNARALPRYLHGKGVTF